MKVIYLLENGARSALGQSSRKVRPGNSSIISGLGMTPQLGCQSKFPVGQLTDFAYRFESRILLRGLVLPFR